MYVSAGACFKNGNFGLGRRAELSGFSAEELDKFTELIRKCAGLFSVFAGFRPKSAESRQNTS